MIANSYKQDLTFVEMPLKQGIVSLDSPKYPYVSIIRDLDKIKEVIKKEDYQLLKQKMNQVFGKPLKQKQKLPSSILNQQSIPLQSIPNCDYSKTPQRVQYKKVSVKRAVQRTSQGQYYYREDPIINPNFKIPRRKIYSMKQKTDQSITKKIQEQPCLPVIWSYDNTADADEMIIVRKSTSTNNERNKHKFLEFVKLLDKLT